RDSGLLRHRFHRGGVEAPLQEHVGRDLDNTLGAPRGFFACQSAGASSWRWHRDHASLGLIGSSSVPWFVTAIKMPLFELTGSIIYHSRWVASQLRPARISGMTAMTPALGGPRAGGVKTMHGTFRPEAHVFLPTESAWIHQGLASAALARADA